MNISCRWWTAEEQMPLNQQMIMQTAAHKSKHLIAPTVPLILLLPSWAHADLSVIFKRRSQLLYIVLHNPRYLQKSTEWYYFWIPENNTAYSFPWNMNGFSLILKPKLLLDLSSVSHLLFSSLIWCSKSKIGAPPYLLLFLKMT